MAYLAFWDQQLFPQSIFLQICGRYTAVNTKLTKNIWWNLIHCIRINIYFGYDIYIKILLKTTIQMCTYLQHHEYIDALFLLSSFPMSVVLNKGKP